MKKLLLLFTVLTSFNSVAQCTFEPTITGDTMLCPNASGILTTQVYDSYQWYKRPFSGTAQPIPGATSQTLNVDYFNDAGFYFSVEATDSGCTEMSPEVLVDGWVFLLPTVQTTGDFTIGPNGETIVCIGDTAYFMLMQPYTTNITWYESGNVIPGATSPVFLVTTPGSYTVQGAPQICPQFIQQLGVTLDVLVINCSSSIDELSSSPEFYPNPVKTILEISSSEMRIASVTINDITGKTVFQKTMDHPSTSLQLNVEHLREGIYQCILTDDKGIKLSRKIVVQK
jgi:hypothetical protein